MRLNSTQRDFFNDVVLKHDDLVRWLEIQGAQAKMGKFHDLSFLQLFKHIKCIFPILACAPCNGLIIEKQEFEPNTQVSFTIGSMYVYVT